MSNESSEARERPRSWAEVSLPPNPRILLAALQGIGNTLLAGPTVARLREALPDAEIVAMVASGQSADVLSAIEPSLECLVLPLRLPGAVPPLLRLRRRFDVMLTLFPANAAPFNLAARVVGARWRVTHDCPTRATRSLRFLQNVRVPLRLDAHDVEQNLGLLEPLGIGSPEQVRLELPLAEREREQAAAFLRQQGLGESEVFIGMHPGSSAERKMDLKRWPAGRFGAVAEALAQEGIRTLVFGGPGEGPLKEAVVAAAPHGAILVPAMDFLVTAAIIGQASAFVSNDSGLMHVAAAEDTPVVGIFGPTDPTRTRPWGSGHIVLRTRDECAPCWPLAEVGYRRDCTREARECLAGIEPGRVVEAVRRLLAAGRGSEPP
ncbi:MAG: glycosyltransferase family 9 protein [Armatimonadota bacterium]